MNIKRQTGLLYLYEALISFRMTDAVWVIFLLGRGFSLAQVGIAEGVFHITSVLCEVPSGMAADLFGRKRTLILSGAAGACSGVLMALEGWSGWVYLGLIFSALSFNLASGTEEAMVYDSLLEAGCREAYKGVRSNMSIVGNVMSAASCTVSPAALALGYRHTYFISVLLALGAIAAVTGLREPVVTEGQRMRGTYRSCRMGARLKRHIGETAVFIREHPRTMGKLFANAAVACPCYLTMMYLQEHLVDCGWPQSWIGLPVLLIPLSGAVGAYLAGRIRAGLFKAVLACGIFSGLGTCLAGRHLLGVVIFGACLARVCSGFAEIFISEDVNRDFTSDQRATLISVDSMLYSVLMVIASPVTGFLGSRYSVPVMFSFMGGTLLLAATALGTLCRYQRRKTRGGRPGGKSSSNK